VLAAAAAAATRRPSKDKKGWYEAGSGGPCAKFSSFTNGTSAEDVYPSKTSAKWLLSLRDILNKGGYAPK